MKNNTFKNAKRSLLRSNSKSWFFSIASDLKILEEININNVNTSAWKREYGDI